MKLSANTSYQTNTGNAEVYLKRIREAGFPAIQWIHEWNNDYMYAPSEMEQIKHWLDKYELVMGDLHASKGMRKDYMSFDEYARRAGVELIRNRIDLAAFCGASTIVLHMPIPVLYWNSPNLDRLYEQAFKSLDELQSYSAAQGVRIAIENLVQTDFQREVDQFTRLFDRYDQDFLGLCYDAGHANCAFANPGEPLKFLELFKDRLLSTHLTDNDGSGDLHWVPFTGTVDWDGLAQLLCDYEGNLTLESVIRRSGIEDEAAYLKESYERGMQFFQLVNKYKAASDTTVGN